MFHLLSHKCLTNMSKIYKNWWNLGSLLTEFMSINSAWSNFMFPLPLSYTLRSIHTHMSWISVCTNWKNQAVFLECSTPRGSHFVSCLWGLMELKIDYKYESKEACWMWSWGESAMSFKITISVEAITDPLHKAGLISLVRRRKAASTGKEFLTQFRNSVSLA